jgi:1,2-diacylglycerol 3-beta-glucosyltransferase
MIYWLSQAGIWAAWLLAVPVAVITLYMLRVVLGSWLSRPGGALPSASSFVVVVPAHNEEQGIAATVAQLLATDYPRELVQIFVIADNCTDATAEVARQAGAWVVVRNDADHRGKGQALDWFLREHRDLLETVELVAFIDADMQVSRNFFVAMSAAFADADTLVAQGRYMVANPSRNILSAIGYASFCYINHVRPAGRCYWGGTADLKGSGMVFRAPFLLPRGWKAHSIAEDMQLGKELMLEGIRVAYVPSAGVASEIPATLSQVRVQQSRWEGGKPEIYASIVPLALRAFLQRPSKLLLDGLLDLMVPPLSILIFLNGAGLLLSWWLGSTSQWIFLASFAVFGLAVFSGLLQNRAPAGVYWRLIAAPAFIVWKVVLLLRVAVTPAPTTWQRTPRDPRKP